MKPTHRDIRSTRCRSMAISRIMVASWSVMLLMAVCGCMKKPTVLNNAPNHAMPAPVGASNEVVWGNSDSNVDFRMSGDHEGWTGKWGAVQIPGQIVRVLTLTNYIRFSDTTPCFSTVVCVDSNEWWILTNAYPTNVVHEEIEFDKYENPVAQGSK